MLKRISGVSLFAFLFGFPASLTFAQSIISYKAAEITSTLNDYGLSPINVLPFNSKLGSLQSISIDMEGEEVFTGDYVGLNA